jgi:tetratricopeptide (TPR) repeat protein
MLSKAYKVLMDRDLKAQYDHELNGNGLGSYRKSLDRAIDAMNRDKFNSALGILVHMLSEYPNDLEIQQNIAVCYNSLGRYEEAKKLLLRLEASYPNNEETLDIIGQTFLNLEMYHQASVYYERLVILNPKDANHYINLSTTYFHLEEYDQAIRILEEKLTQGKETVYDFPLLEQMLVITMVADKRMYHQDVIKRIKNLYTTNAEKEQLLNMLISSCEGIENTNNGFKGLVLLIKDINNSQDKMVNDWLVKAESNIRRDLIYYGDSPPSQSKFSSRQPYDSSNSSNTVETYVDEERGSIFFSIILGIIASFFLTPIGGIIVGIVWYFNAAAIKRLLAVLAFVAIGLIILGVIIVGNL